MSFCLAPNKEIPPHQRRMLIKFLSVETTSSTKVLVVVRLMTARSRYKVRLDLGKAEGDVGGWA